MVDFSKPVMCGADYKDYYKRPYSLHLHTDVVLLDRTTNPLEPCLYQLNTLDDGSHNDEAFTRLGEVVNIDTQKKTVELADDNIVTYQHLIIAAGPKSSWMDLKPGKEFAAGVHVLMDALRLQEKKPSPPVADTEKGKINHATLSEESRNDVIPKPQAPEATSPPAKDAKRVYQVQL